MALAYIQAARRRTERSCLSTLSWSAEPVVAAASAAQDGSGLKGPRRRPGDTRSFVTRVERSYFPAEGSSTGSFGSGAARESEFTPGATIGAVGCSAQLATVDGANVTGGRHERIHQPPSRSVRRTARTDKQSAVDAILRRSRRARRPFRTDRGTPSRRNCFRGPRREEDAMARAS